MQTRRAEPCADTRADNGARSARRGYGCEDLGVARTWLSITVELVEGGGRSFWPRPGRVFAAAPSHSFASLAVAIDDAFARWDRSHLHEFRLADDTRMGQPEHDWNEEQCLDDRRTKLSRLVLGQQFLYVFDFGDGWHHVCSVANEKIDPLETLGISSSKPLPYGGMGRPPGSVRPPVGRR